MLTRYAASIETLIDAMHRIKNISSTILRDKLQDSSVALSDTDAKRDIMSLLVHARKENRDKNDGGYAMSDLEMVDQVVCAELLVLSTSAHWKTVDISWRRS